MNFLLRVLADGTAEDVVATVQPSHTVRDLLLALAEHSEKLPDEDTCLRDPLGNELVPDLLVAETGIVSGDILYLESRKQSRAVEHLSGLRLIATSGPGSGLSVPIHPGSYSIGRDRARDEIVLNDQSVSRQHAELWVSQDGSVHVSPDAKAANPVLVNGQEIQATCALRIGDRLRLGSSELTLTGGTDHSALDRGSSGFIPFSPEPQFSSPAKEAVFEPVDRSSPEPTGRDTRQLIATLIPLVLGTFAAVTTGRYAYLASALFTSLMVFLVSSAIGRRRRRRNSKQFEERLAERVVELDAALDAERARQSYQSPDIAQLAYWVETRDTALWTRRREDDSFLQLRIGVGDVASHIVLEPERSDDVERVERVRSATQHADLLRHAPILIDLVESPIFCVSGSETDVRGIASMLAVQAACLHSPAELAMAFALEQEDEMARFAKWLPHTNSPSSSLGRPHIGIGSPDSTDLLKKIGEAISEPSALAGKRPWMLLIIDGNLSLDPQTKQRILNGVSKAALSVIWLAPSGIAVPRDTAALLRSGENGRRSKLSYPKESPQHLDAETVMDASFCDRISMKLAPLRDVSSADSMDGIPRTASFFEAIGVETCDADWVAESWQNNANSGLRAPIGLTQTGPLVVDLEEHGPHALITGASGSGKTELLASILTGMAVFNSPSRVNFLLLDAKGVGTDRLSDLPHTVGTVASIDSALVPRVLTSLTAELNRRMSLLQGRATDIQDMWKQYPAEAPPYLLVVVDEFAMLVRYFPEFVDGLIAIAERGRSLGLHLLLATQRPGASINEQVRQNTNLRISLRQLDSSDSLATIGKPDAAYIPAPLKGRGLANLNGTGLIQFQTVFTGAPATDGTAPVVVRTFDANSQGVSVKSISRQQPSQLDVTVDAVTEAAMQLGLQPGRTPWLPILPETLSLQAAHEARRNEGITDRVSHFTIGIVDDPTAQTQRPAAVDLKADGSLLIFGSKGSGKSSALRTVCISAAIADSNAGGGALTIFAIDSSARELSSLAMLPQCGEIALATDPESLTRVIDLLTRELGRREARADSQESSHPAILLAVDGFDGLRQLLTRNIQMASWFDRLEQVVVDGPRHGIFTCATASQTSGFSRQILETTRNRLVLRQVDNHAYGLLGVPADAFPDRVLDPGMGFLNGDLITKVAQWTPPSGDPTESLYEAFAEQARALSGTVPAFLKTRRLPPMIEPFAGRLEEGEIQLGLADSTLKPVGLSIAATSLGIFGPPRSGRSSALLAIAEQLHAGGAEVWTFGPDDHSPLRDFTKAAGGGFGGESSAGIEEFVNETNDYPHHFRVAVFDDLDYFDETTVTTLFNGRSGAKFRTVGAAVSPRGALSNRLIRELTTTRSMLFLRLEDPHEFRQATGFSPDLRPGVQMTPGRAVLASGGQAVTLQLHPPRNGFAFDDRRRKQGLVP